MLAGSSPKKDSLIKIGPYPGEIKFGVHN